MVDKEICAMIESIDVVSTDYQTEREREREREKEIISHWTYSDKNRVGLNLEMSSQSELVLKYGY